MSHLAHINKYKINLIAKGITEPTEQIALVRQAYGFAFVQLFTLQPIPSESRNDVMQFVLGYWNETFPVNGNYVITQVNMFMNQVNLKLGSIAGPITLTLTDNDVTKKHPNYAEIDGFRDLVNTLYQEARHKYKEVQGV